MSLQDPISDALTRIRNAQRAGHLTVAVARSKMIVSILLVLKEEGFIRDFHQQSDNERQLVVKLKYYEGQPVIRRLQRVSRPGLRVYKPCKMMRQIGGFGVAIISTPKGVMSDRHAKQQHHGGEVVCEVA